MLLQQDISLPGTAWQKQATWHRQAEITPKARIFYFHGGGLLYGSRKDLPQGHLELFTRAGYEILAFDYPLAPAADLEIILEDVCCSIHAALHMPELMPIQSPPETGTTPETGTDLEASTDPGLPASPDADTSHAPSRLPYYLWGRSAGAYLCLLAAASGRLEEKPAGVLSYYGYGFLLDSWFSTPASYYKKLPSVDVSCLHHIPQGIHTEGSLDRHYSVYVYARQTGNWKQLIYKGREKYFYLNYSLRAYSQFPCPLFAAHSTGDPDVPYGEFLELCSRYHPTRFIASGTVHDFDREPDGAFTVPLLEASLRFLEEHT